MNKWLLTGAALTMALTGIVAATDRASALTIFADNLNGSTVGPQWSTNVGTLAIASAAGAPNAQYLASASGGELGLSNQTVSLALTGLAAHNNVTLTFGLVIIRTMDGDETFTLSETSVGTIVSSNFENLTFSNPFGGSNHGNGSNAAFGHADAENSLGITPDSNSGAIESALYSRSFIFAHSAPNLNLNFAYAGLQALSDESWAIDNVTVEIDAVEATIPAPAALPLMLAGIACLTALARRRTGKSI